MIDPTRLSLLVALHERGTLHAAASALHISPSAASQQLATLTKEAGAPLTEVDGRRLRLTESGRVLVDHAYALLAHMERALGDVQAAANGALGQLCVGAVPSLIPTLLIPAARAVREQYPRLRVGIHEITMPDCLDRLCNGELDVIVSVTANVALADDDPRCTRVELGTEECCLAVPADHPIAQRGAADLALLADQDWISTLAGDTCDQLLHSACAAAGFQPTVRHRASDWAAVIALVEAGLGVALVPRSARLPATEAVTTVATTGHPVQRRIHAAIRRGTETRPAVANFLTALKSAAPQSR
ncbi:LysR family transcriptional regulator [Saccharopolyspora sp. K220]|uniref:LysR family transcriptional regulator n=1 Tax=Saccharopolyspora soli TaxID=2926618 RepID=UPI001F585AAE|nr:LysR family transcriptional regulator [Saccharopolyspora soli]MCI2416363.1 LysR family transcriptional regulator [Saccharopolyspora soli]